MSGAWLLLAPAGLWGLLALGVPIAIHLISRGRGRRVLIGNLELVRAARQAQVTTPRITEWLLLLLRLLVILVATLLLARLALPGLGAVDSDASYVTPGWLAAATVSEREALLGLDPPARVLAAGYPAIGDYTPAGEGKDYNAWPLLAERLSTLRHAGRVDVYAERRASNFGEQRPALPGDIHWHLAAGMAPAPAIESRGLVVYDDDRSDDVETLERALGALKRYRVAELAWTRCVVDDAACQSGSPDWIAWLSDRTPDVGRARLYQPDASAWSLAVTDPRYPDQLLDALLTDEQRRRAWQSMPVSTAVLATGADAVADVPLPYRSLTAWLGLALVLLWGAERFMSERARGNADG